MIEIQCRTCTRNPFSRTIEKGYEHKQQGTRYGADVTYRLVPFKEDDTTAFVPSSEVIASMVELDGGDDIG